MDAEAPAVARTLAVCIPVYNDWLSVALLLERLDRVAESLSKYRLEVLLVDDGSEVPSEVARSAPEHLSRVSVLSLRRNLGHQRAIAIGLTYLYVHAAHDAIVVMDADGEDRPEDIPLLLERCEAHEHKRVIFARRTRRSESLTFRVGYRSYKLVHQILVGRGVNVGNFSVVPRAALARVVCVSETWNHYAASVHHARIPLDSVPIARGTRIAGRSTMNLVSLAMHGLSAISVYSDVVGVRLLALIALIIVLVSIAILSVLAIRLYTQLAIPGWATSAAGMLVISLLNLTLLGTTLTLFTLRARSEYSFLPLRDYEHFVLAHRICYESDRP